MTFIKSSKSASPWKRAGSFFVSNRYPEQIRVKDIPTPIKGKFAKAENSQEERGDPYELTMEKGMRAIFRALLMASVISL